MIWNVAKWIARRAPSTPRGPGRLGARNRFAASATISGIAALMVSSLVTSAASDLGSRSQAYQGRSLEDSAVSVPIVRASPTLFPGPNQGDLTLVLGKPDAPSINPSSPSTSIPTAPGGTPKDPPRESAPLSSNRPSIREAVAPAKAMVPAPTLSTALSPSPLGLCINGIVADTPAPVVDKILDEAVKLGSGGIRVDIPWQGVEWGRDQWAFEGYDELIRGAVDRGLRVDIILDYNNPLYGGQWNQMPLDLTAWSRYVTRVVAQYRGQATSYEIWNEPDTTMFNADAADPGRYLELLQVTYGLVKRGGQNALVVAAAMADQSARPPYWAAIASQAQPFFDVANLHIYGGDLDARVAAAARMSPGKPLWVTELGHDAADETLQAEYLTQTVRKLQSHSVDAIWVFQLRDRVTAETPRRYGMLDDAWRPRPAASAFRSLARSWAP